jgi:hypothetical protein
VRGGPGRSEAQKRLTIAGRKPLPVLPVGRFSAIVKPEDCELVKNTLLVLACAATSSVLISAPPVMTNYTIQAMISGGVSVPVIIRAIKTATKVDLYMNDRECTRLKDAGASIAEVNRIVQAIHDREYNGVDLYPAEESLVSTAIAAPVAQPVAVAIRAPVAVTQPVAVPVVAAAVMPPAVPVAELAPVIAPPLAVVPVSAPGPSPSAVVRMTLEDSTPVKLRLSKSLSSADVSTDDTIDFEVLEEVKIGEQVVIPKGSVAWGTVTDAEKKRRMGRAGKLDVTLDSVRLSNGQKAALRGVKNLTGNSKTGSMVSAIVVTSLVLWPAAPLFLLIHGKDVTIPKGTAIPAYIDGNVTLDSAKFVN